jgi:hypothetical protein
MKKVCSLKERPSMSSPPLISDSSNLSVSVKKAMVQDIRECRLSRPQISERLSGLVGVPVSVAMLDAYTADTKPHRFPAAWIPAWVRITGSRRILAALCERAGFTLADRTEHRFAELGRTYLRRRKDEQAIADLGSELEGQA